MANNNLQPFNHPPKEFKDEEEISQFFEENLNLIFPNFTHIRSKWEIVHCSHDETKGKIDALALYSNSKNRRGRLVLLEYKHKDPKDPVNQLLNYFKTLKNNPRNLDKLQNKYNKVLKEKKEAEIDWDFNEKQEEEFLKDRILIAVATPNNFDKGHKDRVSHKDEEVILVEVRKYGDEKVEFILLSLIPHKENKKHKELLGINSDHIIIQKEPFRKKIKIDEEAELGKDIVQNEKELDVEWFLKESKADEWAKTKIKEIDKCIQLLNNSIEREATQPVIKGRERRRYFGYYKKKKLLFIYPRPRKKEFIVYLRKNKATAKFDKENTYKNLGVRKFERMIVIKDEDSYQKFFERIENYLEEVIKNLGT